jgi:hypothetical protein
VPQVRQQQGRAADPLVLRGNIQEKLAGVFGTASDAPGEHPY